IEPDQAGHDGQQHLVCDGRVIVHAQGLALQVGDSADLSFSEDLEAPEMQAAQDGDRSARIHSEEVTWSKVPAEIYLAMRNHTRTNARIFSISPAYMCLCHVHIANIGKALGPQQFLNNLWREAGRRVCFEADGGDFRRRLR